MVTIPGGQSIEELQKSVEFIKLIMDSENLDQIMSQLAAAKKEAEDERGMIAGEKSEVQELIIKNNEMVAAGAHNYGLAEKKEKQADAREKDSAERLRELNEKQQALDTQARDFNDLYIKTNNVMEGREQAVTEREEALPAKEAAADEKYQEYSEKIAAINDIAR